MLRLFSARPVHPRTSADIERAERRRIATELRAAAETCAPGGRGLPNECYVADALLDWAYDLEQR